MDAATLLLAQSEMTERQREARQQKESDKRRAKAESERARYHGKKAQARAQRKAEKEARRIARQKADPSNGEALDALARAGKLSLSAQYNAGFLSGFSAGREYESRTAPASGQT